MCDCLVSTTSFYCNIFCILFDIKLNMFCVLLCLGFSMWDVEYMHVQADMALVLVHMGCD